MSTAPAYPMGGAGGGEVGKAIYGGSVRVIHGGFSTLTFHSDELRSLVVDPHEPGEWTNCLLTGGPWAERYSGLADHTGPVEVAAPSEAMDWANGLADVTAHPLPHSLAGMRISSLPYAAREHAAGATDRLRAALRNPGFVRDRMAQRRGKPSLQPHAVKLAVPHGHTIVYLGLALHQDTTSAFVEQAREFCADAHTVIAGYPHGEGESFDRHVRVIAPKRLLLMDQTNDLRRAAGLPVSLLTPVRDKLQNDGLETHVFVTATSFRFEQDDTVKRW